MMTSIWSFICPITTISSSSPIFCRYSGMFSSESRNVNNCYSRIFPLCNRFHRRSVVKLLACYIPMKFLIYLHITSVCVYDAVVYITMYVVISIQETIIHDSFGGVCFCDNSHTTPICR